MPTIACSESSSVQTCWNCNMICWLRSEKTSWNIFDTMKYPLRNASKIKWLDCVAVGRLLCAIHDLIGQALGDGLDVSEGTVSCTSANQVDGLIHSAQWGHIYSLTAHHTCWTHTCGVFTRTPVLHSIHEHLDGVLVGEEVDDLEGMLDNAHCHELLAVVAAMHHHGAHQALNDGAQSLSEASHLVSALSVGKEQLSRFADGNVVHQTQVRQHHILVGPQSHAVMRGWHSGFTMFLTSESKALVWLTFWEGISRSCKLVFNNWASPKTPAPKVEIL